MRKMCGEALKSEIAFQEEDARAIHAGHIAGDTTFPDSETGGRRRSGLFGGSDETSPGPKH